MNDGRRLTVKRLGLWLVLMVMFALVAACGSAPPAPQASQDAGKAANPPAQAPAAQPQAPTQAPAAQPQAPAQASAQGCGKEVIIGINGDGQSVNPLYGSDSSTVARTDVISEPLVFLDAKTMQPIPWLAKSWEVSPDGTTYTFKLQDGPKWPDGKPLRAQDFEFTLLTILSKDYTGPWQSLFRDLVGADKVMAGSATSLDGVKVVDDKTLQLKLNQPNAAFLPNAVRNLKPIPRHILEGQKLTPEHPFMQNPVGVGPYKVKEWVKGDHLTLEAKPDYWGKPVCSKMITERIIPDMNALGLALESGSVDQMNPLEPRFVTRFKNNPDLAIYDHPTRSLDAIYFNLKNPTLADVKVRQAIAMSLNMEEFSQRVLGGIQAPVLNPLLKSSWAFDASLKQPSPDMDKAKALLTEAKVPADFSVKIRTNAGNTTREQMATYLQAQMQKLGLKAEVELQEWSTFIGGVTQGNFDIVVLSSSGGIPDPDTLYSDYHTKGSTNYGKYSNPELDKVLEQARATNDVEQRKKLYVQAQQILVKDVPRVWAYEYLFSIAARKNISNITPSALGPMWDAKDWRKQ